MLIPSRTRNTILLTFLAASCLWGADRQVDPTFLHCYLPDLQEKDSELSTSTCHYKPVFGEGAPGAIVLKGITRIGEVTLDSGGSSQMVVFPHEEQIFVILEGSCVLINRDGEVSLRKDDFLYLPPDIHYKLSVSSGSPCHFLVAGFRIPAGTVTPFSTKVLRANLEEVPKQTVAGHPPTVLYQLMIGDVKSTRDRIAAGHVLTSLYIMEFAPGGTNSPHHHETEEEFYLVLEGNGEMVAGGGLTGIEGRYPVKAGDAYFFRLNCTVGFYNNDDPVKKSRILGIRSLFPFSKP
ncbi:MAG TPA: cupin domain-containing protein [Terriglobia bacterium]|nr:cupin domain-containing protein [Terriglobia bacterium]